MFRLRPGGCSLFRVTNARLGPEQSVLDGSTAWGSLFARLQIKEALATVRTFTGSDWNDFRYCAFP